MGTRALKAFGYLGTRAFEALGHSKGTWELGHSKGTWSFGHSRHLDTWTLRQLDTRALKGHLGTQALGAWELDALGVLFLADTDIMCL